MCGMPRAKSLTGFCLSLYCLAQLAGCGFHLRGSTVGDVTMPAVFVASTRLSAGDADVQRLLEQWLRRQDTRVTTSKDEAKWVVVLFPETRHRRVTSVNDNGKAQEYELRYQLRFEVRDVQDTLILPARVVSVTRQYAFNAEAVLSNASEEQDLWRAMQQEASGQIGFQLQRLAAREETTP